jgi:hypothetical protein
MDDYYTKSRLQINLNLLNNSNYKLNYTKPKIIID